MKAAVYYSTGDPSVLIYEDVPDPTVGADDVLISVEAISIEGGDTLNRLGGVMASVPHVVGYQCAGTIIQVGENVTNRHEGQRVVATMMWGSHAALVAVPAIITWVLPAGADVIESACIPVAFGTAHDCLFEFGFLKAGETVLIQAAAGGLGLAAVQLANRAGATVIATASSDARLEKIASYGIDHGINYSNDDWVHQVRAITGGSGVDLVVDSVGGSVLRGSIGSLRYRGRAITVGSAGRDPQPFDLSLLGAGNHSLTGVFLGAEIISPRVQAMIAGLIEDVASGELRVLVDSTFALSEAAAAHSYIESRQATGRVVLIP